MVHVIGRKSEANQVLFALERSGACAIVGPGGVGKTTLLAAVVEPLGDRMLLIDARAALRVDEVLDAVAVKLDVDHVVDIHGAVDELVVERLADRLSAAGVELLVVDHVDGRTSDAILDALTRLAERSDDLAVLVASRSHPVLGFGEVVRLRPLHVDTNPESAAATLFDTTFVRAGGDPSVLAANRDGVHQLLVASGGLPLAIVVVASRAAVVGLQFDDGETGRSDSSLGGSLGSDLVNDVLERSLDDLDVDAHRVFEAIGTFRSDPSVANIAAVCELDHETVSGAVERLARRSLVEVVAGRVGMLAPVRNLADRHALQRGTRDQLERRHMQWAYAMACAAAAPTTSEVIAVEDDLIRAVATSFGEARLDATIAIARMLDDAYRADLRHRRRVDMLEPVLRACRGASTSGDRESIDTTIEILRLTAMAYADVVGSTSASALLDEAATLVDRSSFRDRHLARIESLRAEIAFGAGALDAARRAATTAIGLALNVDDELARFNATKLLADVALESGDLGRAVDLANEVMRDAPASMRPMRAYATATVGACELERGATSLAIAAALAIAHEAVEAGDLDLVVEADWLIAMADPQHPGVEDVDLAGDRIGNSVIHIQADIARALRQLTAGSAQSAITLAADCELRANALPMRSLAIDAQLLVGAAAVELGASAEAVRAFRQALTDASRQRYLLRVPDALDGLAAAAAITSREHSGIGVLRAVATMIRAQLGVVARPAPWRTRSVKRLSGMMDSVVMDDWVVDGELAAAGLEGVLSSLSEFDEMVGLPTDRLVALSPAERLVADLVAEGLTNREIGERLFVSRRTVETHIAHAFQKLDVRSRTQLAGVVLAER